jgi:hypothetical protein
MLDQGLLSLAREARVRAEEILAKTQTFEDADAKQRMRNEKCVARRRRSPARPMPAATAAHRAIIVGRALARPSLQLGRVITCVVPDAGGLPRTRRLVSVANNAEPSKSLPVPRAV